MSILPCVNVYPEKPFQKLVETIREVADCDVCSLWRINDLEGSNTHVSLIERTPHNDALERYLGEEDHHYNEHAKSFFTTVLSNLKETKKPYYFCSGGQNIKDTCLDFVEGFEVEHIVGIPAKKEEEETIAILALSFKNSRQNSLLNEANGMLTLFSEIVSPYLAFIIQKILDERRFAWIRHEVRHLIHFILTDIQRINRDEDRIIVSRDGNFSSERLFGYLADIEKSVTHIGNLFDFKLSRKSNKTHSHLGKDDKKPVNDLLQECKRSEGVGTQCRKPKILWVDDDFIDDTHLLIEYVEELESEFEIEKAESFDEALEKLESETMVFSCIILDVYMPCGERLKQLLSPRLLSEDRTGIILKNVIRKMEKYHDVPIVMLTSAFPPESIATQQSNDQWYGKADVSAEDFRKIIELKIKGNRNEQER